MGKYTTYAYQERNYKDPKYRLQKIEGEGPEQKSPEGSLEALKIRCDSLRTEGHEIVHWVTQQIRRKLRGQLMAINLCRGLTPEEIEKL